MSGPKYILELKASADARKKERELRKLRSFIKERETCRPDEEVYISKAYKDKLVELGQDAPKDAKFVPTNDKHFYLEKEHRQYKDHSREKVRYTHKNKNSRFKDDYYCKDPHSLKSTATSGSSSKSNKLDMIEKKLEKRNVGKLFKEAVQRYQNRISKPRGFPFE